MQNPTPTEDQQAAVPFHPARRMFDVANQSGAMVFDAVLPMIDDFKLATINAIECPQKRCVELYKHILTMVPDPRNNPAATSLWRLGILAACGAYVDAQVKAAKNG